MATSRKIRKTDNSSAQGPSLKQQNVEVVSSALLDVHNMTVTQQQFEVWKWRDDQQHTEALEQNVTPVNEPLVTKIINYTKQCHHLFEHYRQHYDNVCSVGQQFSTTLLYNLSQYKAEEWYMLTTILYERSIRSSTGLTTYKSTKIMELALQDCNDNPTPLEIYKQQCYDLLERTQSCYESIKVVGNNCTLETLRQLVVYKDLEWKILCDMHNARRKLTDNIFFALNGITCLISRPISEKFSEKQYAYSLVRQKFSKQKEILVFGEGTAAATKLLLKALTTDKLNNFADCILQMIQTMLENKDIACPTARVQNEVQAIIKKGKVDDNRTDIFTISIELTFTIIGNKINIHNIDYNHKTRVEYKKFINNLEKTTRLLLYKYMLEMHQLAIEEQAVRL